MDAYNLLTLIIAAGALIVSALSWRASVHAIRASTYDQRYQIYADTEKFLGPWIRDAHPDLGMLHVLIGAWTRSHFLCDPAVTAYLHKVWLDAIAANHARKVMSGEAAGDHAQAVAQDNALLLEHANFDKLRATFMPDLRVHPRLIRWRWPWV